MTRQERNEQGGQNHSGQPSGAASKAEPRLSDAALILLGAAAGRADGLLLPPPASCRARGKALERVLESLLKAGLVYEVTVATEEQAWRMDETGKGVGLVITDAGRRAIGMPAEQGSVSAEGPAQKRPASGKPKPVSGARAAAVSSPVSDVSAAASTRASSVGPERQRLTKHARLISLLSEPEGQSVVVLGEALGWLPHTVRAALTGLRQKGFAVTKSKDETGTTLYRVECGAGAAGSAAKAA